MYPDDVDFLAVIVEKGIENIEEKVEYLVQGT